MSRSTKYFPLTTNAHTCARVRRFVKVKRARRERRTIRRQLRINPYECKWYAYPHNTWDIGDGFFVWANAPDSFYRK